ncbi:MAG TPA: hypothetical protein VK923_11700 [Euzebyales bacterium]|nr:hypothetical protein [Euzebyales bacterium]
MTLRARIAVTAAAAVALAFLIAAGGLYAARTLRGEVDRSLAGIAEDLTSGRPGRIVRSLAGARAGALGGPGGFVQRTPLTSLRTNIEVLTMDAAPAQDAGPTPLSPADRRQLLADLTIQLDEFSRLVGALVELARGAQPAVATVQVQLDDLVATAVDRARAFAGPDQRIDLVTTPVTVHARPTGSSGPWRTCWTTPSSTGAERRSRCAWGVTGTVRRS